MEICLFVGLNSSGVSEAIEFSLPLLERLRLGIPKMKKLWEVSALQMSGRDNAFQNYLFFEQEARKKLSSGEIDMKAAAKPESDAAPNWM